MTTHTVKHAGICTSCKGNLSLTGKRVISSIGKKETTMEVSCNDCALLYDANHIKFAAYYNEAHEKLTMTDPDY